MSTDNAKLLLRLTLGILVLFHGWSKITNGVGFIEGLLGNYGLPGFLAYLVYFGEVVAPLLLLAGAYVRIGAALIIANMVVGLLLVHTGEFFALNAATGGWMIELQVFYLMTAIVILMLGAGKYSFMPASKWN